MSLSDFYLIFLSRTGPEYKISGTLSRCRTAPLRTEQFNAIEDFAARIPHLLDCDFSTFAPGRLSTAAKIVVNRVLQ